MLLGTSGLSIVAFPAIAGHAAAGRRAGLNMELAHAIRFFLFLIVPVCIGLAAFSTPVVRLLFERGRFAPTDTRAVALLVMLYTGVIFGAGLGDLLSRTFYAQQNTLTPVIVHSVAFTVAAGLSFCRSVGLAPRAWSVRQAFSICSTLRFSGRFCGGNWARICWP